MIAPTAPVVLASAFFDTLVFRGGVEADLLEYEILYAIWFAYVPALFMGLPLYLFLRGRTRLTALSGALGGAAVAPAGIGVMLVGAALFGGYRLAAPDVFPLALELTVTAPLGAIGGWMFWLVLKPRREVFR